MGVVENVPSKAQHDAVEKGSAEALLLRPRRRPALRGTFSYNNTTSNARAWPVLGHHLKQRRGRERRRGNAGADSVTAAANDRAARASTPTPARMFEAPTAAATDQAVRAVHAGRLLLGY